MRRLPVVVVCALAFVAAGCNGSSHPSAVGVAAGCAPAFQEPLDSQSTKHLFPGAPAPHYLTNPPTSGPHQLGPPPTGVVTTPIPAPRQVFMLEIGYVILQYQDLPPADVASLGTLAGTLVTVAPAAAPLPNRVVATAWTWKQECGAADTAALSSLRAFITAHVGKGFSHT
jgi:hypothetical protein